MATLVTTEDLEKHARHDDERFDRIETLIREDRAQAKRDREWAGNALVGVNQAIVALSERVGAETRHRDKVDSLQDEELSRLAALATEKRKGRLQGGLATIGAGGFVALVVSLAQLVRAWKGLP